MYRYFFAFLLCFFLSGCGPKSVGQDAEQAEITGVGYANDDPSILRYPLSGKRIDAKLYMLNSPQYMQQWQTVHSNQLRRANSAPNDYNNLQPREASPFRQ